MDTNSIILVEIASFSLHPSVTKDGQRCRENETAFEEKKTCIIEIYEKSMEREIKNYKVIEKGSGWDKNCNNKKA